nr:primase-helicase zinc-binding domain-containing protein [Devosia sp. 1635]
MWSDFKGWKLGLGTDKAGPCPLCGGTDRFAIHTTKNTFHCRRCDLSGGGVIDLVMKTEKVGFIRACELITGRTVADPISAEEMAQIALKAEQRERERAAEEEKRRLRAISEGLSVWNRAAEPMPIGAGGVADYLQLRGLPATIKFDKVGLREIRHLDYVVEVIDGDRRRWETIHSGPAMVAAVVLPNHQFGAVHQTWLDLDQPKGKAVLRHPTRTDKKTGELELLPSKKVRGTKRGGAIRLYTPKTVHRIVMGEGIETTLTAMAHNFEPGTAYWAGVDLGNMSGKAYRDIDNHRHEERPDLDDLDCFLPPDWCDELVYLCDSDEPETKTVEKATRGLIRALERRERARVERPELPYLNCQLVPPIGDGKDLNDLVRVTA